MSDFKKFPAIEGFHNIYRKLKKYFPATAMPLVYYRGKIKIHGTNAAIRIDPDGTVTAQKRTADVDTEHDNAGFCAWVKSTEKYWSDLAVKSEVIFYGEWAGPGIQKGVAVSNIEKKTFFIFALMLDDDTVILAPDLIEAVLLDRNGHLPDTVRILPWATEAIEFDFMLPGDLERVLEGINKEIVKIDDVDPYILSEFDVSGPGEGIVFVPCSETGGFSSVPRDRYSRLMFKAKGQKHMQVKQKNPMQVSPELAKSISDFADMFVTEPRLQQGLTEALDGDADMTKMGDFLKWMGNDIKKESGDELEASGLEWKKVAKGVTLRARDWLIKESMKVN